jgi:glycosyltransferase involved in cell wall biosynthesis
MSPAPAAFAIPGDIRTRTGGYIYERSLLDALRAEGRQVEHVPLAASYPDPSAADDAATRDALAAIPSGVPLILDGLVFGAMDTAIFDSVSAPVIAMIHHPLGLETGLPTARASELLKLEAANLARAEHVVVPSPHTARILHESFGVPEDRISIAPPGFPPADPARAEVTPPLILSVGLLAPRKGHDTLLDALALLADLDWKAEIVGRSHDPATAGALRDRCTALGLDSRVRFAGELGEDALRERFRAASIFALATHYEGYGMVFSEAMLHGLPIVGCAVGAVPDTVPPGTGILVPPADPDAFAHALRRLLSDADLRRAMAEASTRAGRALTAWPDTARIMGGVIDRLAAGAAR